MRIWGEVIFDVLYLVLMVGAGGFMTLAARNEKQRLMGIMLLFLGIGDGFHLVPRVYALLTDGLDAHYVALGMGKLVTSVTMTVFYVLLYVVWRQYYGVTGRDWLTASVLLLAGVRTLLCLLPQNEWLARDPSHAWGLYRNIPFVLMGALIAFLFWRSAQNGKGRRFRWAWLAIVLSFVFYLIVVLFADRVEALGMMMLPKTVCYLWLALMCWRAFGDGRLAEKSTDPSASGLDK